MSRLEKSVKNIIYAFGNSFFSSVLSFVSRTVFIYCLGSEYLGLSGLLNNVLGMLTITDMGISTAIGFSLYKPLAKKDYESVSALMSVYRKSYATIGGIVFFSGIVLFQFLDFFVPVAQQPKGTGVAYFAFLLNIVIGYFFSYKTTLLASDHKSYKIVPLNINISILQTVLQVIVLLIWKNYVIYLAVQIIGSILIVIMQNRLITKLYKEVDFYSNKKISVDTKQELKRSIGGLIIGKLGDYLVNSTDNLIITKMVSLGATGIYSNYLLIRNMINGYIATIFAGITGGMGNVVAVENDKKKLEIFNTMFFCAFFIYSLEATCFMCLFNIFIGDIWIGKEYVFDTFTVAIIVINNFLTGLRIPIITMKSVAGKYMEDAWVPFAFGTINFIISILLVRKMGISGVFLGTIVSSILTADWYRPIVIYKTVFHAPVRLYFKKYALYICLGLIYIMGTYGICNLVRSGIIYVDFIISGIIAVMLPTIVSCILFYKTSEFKTIKNMGQRIANGIKKKVKPVKKL